jgi:hypothetical protein
MANSAYGTNPEYSITRKCNFNCKLYLLSISCALTYYYCQVSRIRMVVMSCPLNSSPLPRSFVISSSHACTHHTRHHARGGIGIGFGFLSTTLHGRLSSYPKLISVHTLTRAFAVEVGNKSCRGRGIAESSGIGGGWSRPAVFLVRVVCLVAFRHFFCDRTAEGGWL